MPATSGKRHQTYTSIITHAAYKPQHGTSGSVGFLNESAHGRNDL